MDVDGRDWRTVNRARWDERVPAHAASGLYDLDAVAAGRDKLRPWEDHELGPIDGLDVVHLQCHIGTDTVGLARRGARVVGIDFSSPALAVAAGLASRCGLEMEWVCADVYDASTAVNGRTFDLVYTGIGALGWLPDLARWARVVADLLRPGGVLYVTELHPMWVALVEDGKTICQDAIGAEFTLWRDEQGSYAAPDAIFEHTASCERLHTISDVLTAVLDAGFKIELFHEFDATPSPTPWLTQGDDKLYRFAEDQYRFPLCYSLRARLVLPSQPSSA
jgi:2-polyprenyl-3-methyl-5-hydroxy-6-metoxy-1,4-benzoquinol methylase